MLCGKSIGNLYFLIHHEFSSFIAVQQSSDWGKGKQHNESMHVYLCYLTVNTCTAWVCMPRGDSADTAAHFTWTQQTPDKAVSRDYFYNLTIGQGVWVTSLDLRCAASVSSELFIGFITLDQE